MFSRRRFMPALLLSLLFLLIHFTALAFDALWPEIGGIDVKSNSSLVVDMTHAADGYIMARAEPSSKSYKLRVKQGKYTLTYDLNSNGDYEVFPLQMGDGKYSVSLYKNASGKKYSTAGSVSFKVKLNNPYSPYLYPNQYVNYTPITEAVSLSDVICGSCTTDQEKFDAVRAFILSNYSYDFSKAASVGKGVLPDINYCTSFRTGICQDLAATAACMLRVQGVPTRLIIGYAGKTYHAWNTVLIDGKEVLYDPTADLNGIDGKIKYSTERYY